MKKYDPANVVMTFVTIITGYADGTFIKGGRAEDTWKLTVGADGDSCRTRTRNASGRVTLTLMQSSPSNDVLGALATLDELSGEGVVPFIMKDLNGTALIAAEEAWVVKPADMEFGKDVGNREWVIECAKMVIEGGAIF